MTSNSVVASNVSSVAITCLPTTTPQCSGTPTSVTATVTETADSSGQQYVYSVTGTFRKLIGGGIVATVPSNPHSVILLGASTTCSGTTNTVDIQGGGSCASTATRSSTRPTVRPAPRCISPTVVHSRRAIRIFARAVRAREAVPDDHAVPDRAARSLREPAAPPTTGLTSRTGCSGPGLYARGLNISSGTCTLTTGIYVVQNGFSVSNGASLNTGAGGVLIYLMSGQFSIGSANSVSITAMTTGTWKGLAVWQIAADTQQIIIGNGAQSVIINGALYGPKAQLVINGGVLPSITALVVQTVNITNGITLAVGTPSVPGLSIGTPATLGPWTVNKLFSATIQRERWRLELRLVRDRTPGRLVNRSGLGRDLRQRRPRSVHRR